MPDAQIAISTPTQRSLESKGAHQGLGWFAARAWKRWGAPARITRCGLGGAPAKSPECHQTKFQKAIYILSVRVV